MIGDLLHLDGEIGLELLLVLEEKQFLWKSYVIKIYYGKSRKRVRELAKGKEQKTLSQNQTENSVKYYTEKFVNFHEFLHGIIDKE